MVSELELRRCTSLTRLAVTKPQFRFIFQLLSCAHNGCFARLKIRGCEGAHMTIMHHPKGTHLLDSIQLVTQIGFPPQGKFLCTDQAFVVCLLRYYLFGKEDPPIFRAPHPYVGLCQAAKTAHSPPKDCPGRSKGAETPPSVFEGTNLPVALQMCFIS